MYASLHGFLIQSLTHGSAGMNQCKLLSLIAGVLDQCRLQRMEKELLELEQEQDTVVLPPLEEPLPETAPESDPLLSDDLLQQALSQPAFDDLEQIHDPENPEIYFNYSNDYGKAITEKAKKDKVDIGLMIACCGLCLGILAIAVYWLIKYL